ncbi:hypothetical protein D3C72_2339240 [compost metagenome]
MAVGRGVEAGDHLAKIQVEGLGQLDQDEDRGLGHQVMLELDQVGGIDAGNGLKLQEAEALADASLAQHEAQRLAVPRLLPGADQLRRTLGHPA